MSHTRNIRLPYTPKRGSACRKVVDALQDGPLDCADIALVMGISPEKVQAGLRDGIRIGFFVLLCDVDGVLHLGLADRVIPAGFTEWERQEAYERRAEVPASSNLVPPSPATLAWANPFRTDWSAA